MPIQQRGRTHRHHGALLLEQRLLQARHLGAHRLLRLRRVGRVLLPQPLQRLVCHPALLEPRLQAAQRGFHDGARLCEAGIVCADVAGAGGGGLGAGGAGVQAGGQGLRGRMENSRINGQSERAEWDTNADDSTVANGHSTCDAVGHAL